MLGDLRGVLKEVGTILYLSTFYQELGEPDGANAVISEKELSHMLPRTPMGRFYPFCGLDHGLIFVCGQSNGRGLVFVSLQAGQRNLL